jgi:hypothetical protein
MEGRVTFAARDGIENYAIGEKEKGKKIRMG